jgi:hypothetical protein
MPGLMNPATSFSTVAATWQAGRIACKSRSFLGIIIGF